MIRKRYENLDSVQTTKRLVDLHRWYRERKRKQKDRILEIIWKGKNKSTKSYNILSNIE